MVVPAGVIVGWPSTVASIPAGWTRVAALDSRHPKGTAAGVNPNVTGGAATHTHTSPTHNHTQNSHVHTGHAATSTFTALSNPQGALTNTPAATHNHTVPDSNATTPTNTTIAATLASADSNPANFEVIWIQSGGTTELPASCLAYFNSASLPTSWNLCDGGGGRPDIRNKFLKGAAVGSNGGGTGGSSTHTHTSSHNHVVTSTHTHTSASTGAASAAGGTKGAASTWVANSVHTHTLSWAAEATKVTNVAGDGNVDTPTAEPPWTKLAVIQNNTGGADTPLSIIALWVGTLATIPAGWSLCDGSLSTPDLRGKFLKGANTTAEIGNTGGAAGHAHTPTAHTHTQNAHAHPTATTSGPNNVTTEGVVGTTCDDSLHTHTATDTNATATNQNATMPVDSTADTQPPFLTVAYIQRLDLGPIIAWPSTVASIPAGWIRVTALDGYHPKGTAAATDPGVTGGAATHNHTSPTHNHTQNSHTHTGHSVSSGPSATVSAAIAGGSMSPSTTHTHTIPDSDATTPTNTTIVATLASASNEPSYYTMIWIQAALGAGIPNSCLAYFNGASLPTNWNMAGGNAFLKGAAAGADASTTGGSSTHTHTSSHNHVVVGTHTHTSAASGASSADTVVNTGGTVQAFRDHVANTHTVAWAAEATKVTNNAADGNVDTPTVEPAWTKLAIIQNNTGSDGMPGGIIGLWIGTLATIPAGWRLCDGTKGTPDMRGKFAKGAVTTGEIGNTGGAAGHAHTPTAHTHTQNAHAHPTATLPAAAGTGLLIASTLVATRAHTHTAADTNATGTNQNATMTVDSTADTQPPFLTVAFIQAYSVYTQALVGTVGRVNLNTNEGFEAGIWPDFFGADIGSWDATQFKYGTKSMKIAPVAGAAGRTITLSGLTPGASYKISGWIYVSAYTQGGINLDVFESGIIDTSGIDLSATNGGWVNYSETFTYPGGGSGTVALRFFGDNSHGGTPTFTAYLDGVVLERASVPLSGTMTTPGMYVVTWGADDLPAVVVAGQTYTVTVSLTNSSTITWPYAGANRISIAYHIRNCGYGVSCPGTSIYSWISAFTDFASNVGPGVTRSITFTFVAPSNDTVHQFCAQFDLINLTWFSWQGADLSQHDLNVTQTRADVGSTGAVNGAISNTQTNKAMPINMVSNGSFDLNTAGWQASGTNTLAIVGGAHRGATCCMVTLNDPATYANMMERNASTTFLARPYEVSAWVYIPGGGSWSGSGAVKILVTGLTSAVQVATVKADMTRTGQWQRIAAQFTPDAGDLSGAAFCLAADSYAGMMAGDILYIDDVRIEPIQVTMVGVLAKQANRLLAGTLALAGGVAKQTTRAMAGVLTFAGDIIATQLAHHYTQVVDGAIALAGGIAKQTNHAAAGTITAAGALARYTSHAAVGTLALAGSIARQTSKTLVGGTLAPVGTIVRLVGWVRAGAITLAGTIAKQTNKPLAGVLSPVGTLARLTARVLAGTITLAGTIAKQTSRPLAGAVGVVSGLLGPAAIGKALAGILAPAGVLGRRVGSALAGAAGLVGDLTKLTRTALVGTLGVLSGALGAAVVLTLAGAVGLGGSLVRQTGKVLGGTSALAGGVGKAISTLLAGTVGVLTGALTSLHGFRLQLTGAVGTLAGGLTKLTSTSLVGAAGNLTGAVARTFVFVRTVLDGAIGAAGALSTSTGKALGGVPGLVGSLTTRTGRLLDGLLGPAGALARSTGKGAAGIVDLAGSLARDVTSSLVGTLAPYGVLVRATATSAVGTVGNLAGALAKRTNRALGGALGVVSGALGTATTFGAILAGAVGGLAGSLTRRTNRVLAGTVGLGGSLVRRVGTSLGGTLDGLAGSVASRIVGLFHVVIGGTLAPAGALARRTGKGLAGAAHVAGHLLRPLLRLVLFIPAHALYGHPDVDVPDVAWFDDSALPMEFWYTEPPPSAARHLGVNLRRAVRVMRADSSVELLPPPADIPTLAWADLAGKTRIDPATADDILLELL